MVARMVALPSCEALEVGDLLIPLVRDAVRSVDLEARRIDVDLGFLGVTFDVFTLFPQWFDWFRGQRHVANALALGHRSSASTRARRRR